MKIIVSQLPPARAARNLTQVGLVLPAYNEEKHIAEIVERALAAGVGGVVCVNDCSKDSTGQIIDRLAEDSRVQAFHHEVNRGKQASVKRGLQAALKRAESEIIAVLDADMQNDPALLPVLCPHLGGCDLVVGRRSRRQMPPLRRLANVLANVPYQIIAGVDIRDVQSGYRVYTREVAQHLAQELTVEGRYTLEHTSMLVFANMAAALGRDFEIAEVVIPCSYAGAESNIRFKDNIQLTWATMCHAFKLARMRS